jgi:hypothetical protein
MRVTTFEFLLGVAGDHLLVTAGLVVLFAIVLTLGSSHTCRVFGYCALAVIREGKHEVSEWREFGRRLKRELTTWNTDR